MKSLSSTASTAAQDNSSSWQQQYDFDTVRQHSDREVYDCSSRSSYGDGEPFRRGQHHVAHFGWPADDIQQPQQRLCTGTVESVVNCSVRGTVIAGVIGALRNVLQQVTVTSSVHRRLLMTSGLTVSAAVVLDETTEDSEGTNDVECTGESQMTQAEMEHARGVRTDCGRTAASSLERLSSCRRDLWHAGW